MPSGDFGPSCCVRVFVRVCVWMRECVLASRAYVFVFAKHCELDLGS